MKELIEWLTANRISFQIIDEEVVELDNFGQVFWANLDNVPSIFKGKDDDLKFNLMENPQVLMDEGINYAAFKFGNNLFYYDLRKPFQFNNIKYIGKRVAPVNKTEFVNLGVHTPYELLNGSGGVDLWAKKAAYLGHKALGICDYNTMAATLVLQKECKNAGIKHVFGYSFTLEFYEVLVDFKIYSMTQSGFQSMMRLQKELMVDSENHTATLSQLLSHGKGNAIVFGKKSAQWMDSNRATVAAIANSYDMTFFQVDLGEYKAERVDIEVLLSQKCFFDKFSSQGKFLINPILICDNYYLDADDAKNKILLNKIASGAAHEQSSDQYFKDIDEHYAMICSMFDETKWDIDQLFSIMCQGTVMIADAAVAAYGLDRNFMPQYDMTPEEKAKYGDRHNMFIQLLEDGLKKCCPAGKEDEYRTRMDYERYVLESTNNVDYMLVQYDMVNWARKQDILVGAGRGSAGGSLILYLLGITIIDPMRYDLLFERFLLPERAGLAPARVTKLDENRTSTNYAIISMNGKDYKFDIDAEFRVMRDGFQMDCFSDELKEGDEIIFDNKDILWEL